jgi:DNA-binding beta-propeller fold protein YncE
MSPNSSLRAAALAGLFAVSLLAACDGLDGGPEAPKRASSRPVDGSTVVRVDGQSGRVEAVIAVGPDPLLLTVASGQVWTLNLGDGTLSRVDPATNRATTVRAGEVVGFTSDGRDLWIAVDGTRLAKIDGVTGSEETSIRLTTRRLFALRDAGFLAVGRRSIWLTVPTLGEPMGPQELWRIDPEGGGVLATYRLGPDPTTPLLDGPYVWSISFNGLSRIDVRSGRTQLVVPSGGPGGPWGVAAGGGSIWMGQQSGEVWRLDPATGRPDAKIPVGGPVRGVAFGGGLAWVTTETSLLSIDPATNEVARRVPLTNPEPGLGPIGVAYLGGSVWVSVE